MRKDDEEVKPLPGVQKVKDSLNWQFIKKLPKDLQRLPRYAGRTWAYRGTLGTTDLVEANKRAAAILQGLIEEWQQAEAASKPTDPAAVTPAQVQAIAQRVYASVLEEDERLRRDRSMLVEHLGEALPVDTIRQANITEFLRLPQRLPLDWHHRMQKGASFAELVKDDHPKCISPTTYDGSYRITVGKFLKWAGVEYGDQGFPRTLATDHVAYEGTREAGEEQQRNFRDDELRRLSGSRQFQPRAVRRPVRPFGLLWLHR